MFFSDNIFNSKCYVCGLRIVRNSSNKPPYIKLHFKGFRLTRIQKELIYRIHFDYLVDHRTSFIKIESLITLVIKKKYMHLYINAISANCPTTTSYLLSHSLVDPHKNTSSIGNHITLPPLFVFFPKQYQNHFVRLLDANVVEQNPEIFLINSFSQCIKYSEDFIENHLKNFLVYSFESGNKGIKCFFENINIQQPSFEFLVKHINEFSVDGNDLQKLKLSKRQIEELKILNKVLIS